MSSKVHRRQPANYDYYYGDPYSRYEVDRRPRARSMDYTSRGKYDYNNKYDYDDYGYDRHGSGSDRYSRRDSRASPAPERSYRSHRRGRSADRHHSRRHDRPRSDDDRHGSSRRHGRHSPRHREDIVDEAVARRFGDPNSGTRVQHAASAALDAAAVEAVRVRNQPGEWVGAKGIRVATAALGAAAVGSAQNHESKKSTNRKLIEATVSGLLANRVVNGPRKELKKR